MESVGEKVRRTGDYDGIIHLAPLTCMPEVIAQNIMPFTRENIPVLTLVCDELMGKAGVLTRVEAFVDLFKRCRNQGFRVGYCDKMQIQAYSLIRLRGIR